MLSAYWRAWRRVARRSAAYRVDRSARNERLLREAVRTANFLGLNSMVPR